MKKDNVKEIGKEFETQKKSGERHCKERKVRRLRYDYNNLLFQLYAKCNRYIKVVIDLSYLLLK